MIPRNVVPRSRSCRHSRLQGELSYCPNLNEQRLTQTWTYVSE
jgi:hypothetical protein